MTFHYLASAFAWSILGYIFGVVSKPLVENQLRRYHHNGD